MSQLSHVQHCFQGHPDICYIDKSTTSHIYNFWLSNLSSLPEGSTLIAIPATQLGVTYLNPLVHALSVNPTCITSTVLQYISQSRSVPDSLRNPLRTSLSSQ